jgi:hypothetical protein
MMKYNVRGHIQFLLHAEVGMSLIKGFPQLYFTLELHLSQSYITEWRLLVQLLYEPYISLRRNFICM